MQSIKYILVNETSTEFPVPPTHHSPLPHLRHHLIVDGDLRSEDARAELIDRLAQLRHHYPKAQILGTSEIHGRDIHASDAMNQLRRALSDYP